MTTIRPATARDFEAFYGKPPPFTVKALVAVNDLDQPVAIGGYHLIGGTAVLAFTDLKPGFTKRDMIRAGRALVAWLRARDLDVIAVPNSDDHTALKHFGFEADGPFWRLA